MGITRDQHSLNYPKSIYYLCNYPKPFTSGSGKQLLFLIKCMSTYLKCVHMHGCRSACAHTCIHARTHTDRHTHTHTHTHMHTHTCTHTQKYSTEHWMLRGLLLKKEKEKKKKKRNAHLLQDWLQLSRSWQEFWTAVCAKIVNLRFVDNFPLVGFHVQQASGLSLP